MANLNLYLAKFLNKKIPLEPKRVQNSAKYHPSQLFLFLIMSSWRNIWFFSFRTKLEQGMENEEKIDFNYFQINFISKNGKMGTISNYCMLDYGLTRHADLLPYFFCRCLLA